MIIERIRYITILAVISIMLLWLPGTVLAQCDETMVAKSKQHFKNLRAEFLRDSKSANEWDFRIAAQDYILLAEQCYQEQYGTSNTYQKIDDGGMLMGSHGPYAYTPSTKRRPPSSAGEASTV